MSSARPKRYDMFASAFLMPNGEYMLYADFDAYKRATEALLEVVRDEMVRLMYAGHGYPAEEDFCPYEGEMSCPDCAEVEKLDAAIRKYREEVSDGK